MTNPLRRILPRTLLARSLMILITPILLIQILSVYIFYERHWDNMTERLAYAVAGELSIMADEIERGRGKGDMDRLAGYAAQNLNMLIGFEPDGVLAGPLPERYSSMKARILHNSLKQQVRRPHIIDDQRDDRWITVGIALENGVMHVSIHERRLFSSSSYIFLLWMIGISVVLMVIAILFMRNQIRPIRKLAVAAERFGRGLDVPPGFKPEGAREVRQAASAFLEMHERIKRQIQQRTAMLAGVSHDLRTPLTRLKLEVAMMPPSVDVSAMRRDIEDMERMINAYLDFARGQGGEQATRTDFREILERIAANIRRQGKMVDLEMDGDLAAHIRPVAMERAIGNLTGNAAKYADHIRLSAGCEAGHIRLIVDDNGPGLPEDRFEDVFKPFVRGEPSRNPATGGVGLGLPITQDIINGHGGRVWLEKSPMGGLRAIVELPN